MKRIATVLAVAGLLASCGSSDDGAASGTTSDTAAESSVESSTAPSSTDESSAEAASTTVASDGTADDEVTEPTGESSEMTVSDDTTSDDMTADDMTGDGLTTDDDDVIYVDSLADMPQACVDAAVELLKRIEPYMAEIDWETASYNEFAALSERITEEVPEFGGSLGDECDNYDFADDPDGEKGFEAMLELALVEAPGVVPYFEYIQAAFGDFDDDPNAPTTCDEAITRLREYAAEGGSMLDLPIAEATAVSGLLTSISTLCSSDEQTAIYTDESITSFLGG